MAFGDMFAGCPVTALTADGSTSGNARCPMVRYRKAQSVYLITAAELSAAGLASGQSIGQISWNYTTAPGLAGSGSLIVYLENTSDVLNNKSTTWSTAISGMTVAHNATTLLPNVTGFFDIPFSGGSPFTYTGGGIYVAFDWCYSVGTLSTVAVAGCNTTSNVAVTLKGTQSATAGCPALATTAASAFRPATRLAPAGFANDAKVDLIYTYGSMPNTFTSGHIMQAIVSNPGNNTLTNLLVTLNITGANTFTNTQTVASLAPCATATVTFAGFTPSATGTNNIDVSVPSDDFNGNNNKTMTQPVTTNLYSYKYTAPLSGGVGFGAGVFGVFVSKFNTGTAAQINEVKVDFQAAAAARQFRIAIYDEVAGQPNTAGPLYTSPSVINITSAAQQAFIPISPTVSVNGNFYVGVIQETTNTANIAFSYQTENPSRIGTFFFANALTGPWTDFGTPTVFPFRSAIEVQFYVPQPPNCPILNSPADLSNACLNGTTLTWASGGGGPTGYRLTFGNNAPNYDNILNDVDMLTATSYSTGALAAGTYGWKVTAYNANGTSAGCATRTFTTNLISCYCASSATDGTFEYITNVQSGTFSNPTGSSLYSNNIGLGAINNVNIGSTFNVTVTQPALQVYDEDRIYIFADWNQDGDWNDAGELCGNGDVTIANGNVTTVVCTVPGSALPGNTLLRIKFGDEVSTTAMNNDPCQGSYTYGEVEDYLLNVTCGSTASSNNPVCQNGSLNLSSTYIGLGTPTGYSWTTTAANGFTSGLQSPNVTASASAANDNGTYTVVITDNNGCTSSASVTVTVNDAPQAQANGSDVCAGTALNLSSVNLLDGFGQTTVGYAWSTTAANGYSSGTQNASVTGSASAAQDAGTYTVVITNNFLCTASASIAIAVNANPALGLISTGDVSCVGLCDGNVTVSASGGLAPYLYADPNSNFSSTGIFTGNQCEGNNQQMDVVDDNGCTANVLYNIGHISSAPPSASVAVPPITGLPVSACNGTGPLAISVPAVAGATYYIWDGPSGTLIDGNNPSNSPTPTGNITFGNPNGSGYYIGVQAANGCGTSTRKVQWVRGTTSVPASVAGNTFACANTNGVAYSTGAVVGATVYTWSTTGDITIASGQFSQNITVDFGPAFTSGTICVASGTSCYTSATKCITITNSVPTLPVITGSSIVCPGPYTYSVPVNPNISSYTWTLPANITGSSTSNSINVTVAAGFSSGNICVTGTSVCGVNTATRCKSLATGVPPTPASISGITNGACGQTVVYTCPSVGPVTYTWSVPSGTINSGQGTNAINATLGTFVSGQVCVTTSNACGTGVPRCITVNGKPNPPGAITSIPASWCANTVGVEFNVDVTGLTGSYTLSWQYPGPAVATYALGGGNSTQLILDWITGSGPVNVTASNACGNSTRTSTQASSCREGETIVAYNTASLNAYPNPTSGLLYVDFTSVASGKFNITITDMAGRTIMSQSGTSVEGANGTNVDMSNLAKGMYMLQLQQNNETRLVKVSVE